jgi:hypothetical protein
MRDLEEKNGKLDTKSMLESGFFAEYAKEGGSMPKAPAKGMTKAPALQTVNPSNTNTEQVLLDAYEARDGLISSFSEVKLGSALADSMKGAINKIGSMIVNMGGEAEAFDPLSHMSGLQAPSVQKYASRVIENTIDSYSLGKIEDAKVDEESNGKSIIVAFTGNDDNVVYRAVGTITTNGTWVGNEAIDYVYTPGAGKMSVKVANQNGEWEDVSKDYTLSWELFENTPEKKIEKKAQTKEEEKDLIENKLDDEINEDFPIEEK